MSKSYKQVVDFTAAKGMTVAQSNEHQRRWTEKGWEWARAHGNYDRSREHLNFEIAPGGKVQPVDKSRSIPKRMAENLAARGIKDPNAGRKKPHVRTVVNFIFGGSRERMHQLAFGDQVVDVNPGVENPDVVRHGDIEAWALDIYKFVCDKWGEENIVGFYVHLDEQNPHIHCTLLPIDGNGKFSFKDIFAGEDKYEFKRRTMQLHEELARVNAKWGLGRGDSISESGAKHRSTEEYRRSLSRECTSLEEEIERNREVLSGYRSEIHSAEIRVRSLRTMIANLEDKCAALQAEMNDVRSQLESGRGDESAMRRRLAGLESQLANVQSKLDDKRAKLVEAERLLEDLNERMEEARMTAETLSESSAKSAREMQLAIRDKVLAAMFESCLGDFRERLPELSPEARSLFDGSLLMEASERINGIVTCAMLLFVHAVDEATTFAEGHGGGGGGNDSGWGRDPDEDDILWARRCMRKACMMMQPASGYKRRR